MFSHLKLAVSKYRNYLNKSFIKYRINLNLRNKLVNVEMAEKPNLKLKSDLNSDQPAKKLKLGVRDEDPTIFQRTVATMCGAWRPEEEYGGLVLVFKTRDPGLSPDPTRLEDYPENIQDFWEASLTDSNDEQVSEKSQLIVAIGTSGAKSAVFLTRRVFVVP